ncbi:MAG: cold-shock protein [Comamonadaceae bacterium]|nr:MAG: cold-shock protein [Comamonadaceae bacterium]
MRFEGTLVQWNDDRGFGFIAPEPAAPKVFVHFSAFAQDGRRPQLGDALTFEIRPDSQGRKQAAAVRRAASGAALRPPAGTTPLRTQGMQGSHAPRAPRAPRASGISARLVALIVLCVCSAGVYWWSANRMGAQPALSAPAARADTAMPTAPLSAPVLLAPKVSFRCDGRKHCSQMTSCAEAKYFLQHCPDPRMDGNGDGVPCEQQWCTGPGAP